MFVLKSKFSVVEAVISSPKSSSSCNPNPNSVFSSLSLYGNKVKNKTKATKIKTHTTKNT